MPDDPMPVFTIKAKDALAVPVLTAYIEECNAHGLDEQAREVMVARTEISLWQRTHIEQTKLPDHKHRPVSDA